MFGFDKMFDFNHDGKLDSWERAAQFQFLDEMLREDCDNYEANSDYDAFANVGLDYDELDMMDPDERREALENVGLNPDDYDF